ncbi:Histidinol phosphatase and related hydrolases of the PHP family [uncultured Clostridium sp.]|uniref:PHP domain-containing protein n=1 Tax=uncultured Clostridium sp. TaxID=59620 RepID=UPI0008228FDE|nr:PHP domain-containing protein [uncultured Clostridium sp.]SCI77304.1 Histidinol phosphatase and related hydrolases of the PHP family [uncultured Clostridium sp.]
MYNRGDFHIHSIASDGALKPEEIILFAKKRNLDIIALTDHNTVNGVEVAVEYGKIHGVKVIPGLELSTRYKGIRIHILGYFNYDVYKNELFIDTINNIKKGNISYIKNRFRDILTLNRGNKKISVEEGIRILRYFSAVVVLAHPVLLSRKIFNEVIGMEFDGIEAKYFANTEEDTNYFIEVANKRNIIYTAGSDYHNGYDYYRSHGCIGDVFLDEEEIESFLEVLNSK